MKGNVVVAKVENTAIISKEYFGDAVIDAFIASRHLVPTSEKSYRNAINQLLKFFASNGITQPAESDADAFINALRANKKSAATLRLYTTVSKMFFAYLERQGIYKNVAANVVLRLRASKTHSKKALTVEQAKKLLSAVKGDSEIAMRDRAIVALALQCGLRTIEIERCDVGDLKDAGDYWSLEIQGKGRLKKDAIVKVAPVVANMINAYIDKRGAKNGEPMFASKSPNAAWDANKYGNRLSSQSIGKLIRRYMIEVKIIKVDKDNDKKDTDGEIKRSPISAHSCRHFAATTAIENGCNIREVSEMLRHSSIVTTTRYVHDISLKTRRAEMAVADTLFGGVA